MIIGIIRSSIFDDTKSLFRTSSKSVDWRVSNYSFVYETSKTSVVLKFKNVKLSCHAKGNYSEILNTSGDYNIFENQWIGTGGKVTFERADAAPDKIWVDISTYTIGMKRSKMVYVIVIETFFLSLVGLIVGLMISIPFVYYFNIYPIELTGEMAEVMTSYGMEPIMPTSVETMIFINQLTVVAFIALITSLYPILTIRKLNIIKSLRA